MRDCMLFVECYLWECYLWESYLGHAILIYLGIGDMRSGGDESVSESTICIGLPPSGGSSFEFLLLQSHSSSSHPPTPVLLAR